MSFSLDSKLYNCNYFRSDDHMIFSDVRFARSTKWSQMPELLEAQASEGKDLAAYSDLDVIFVCQYGTVSGQLIWSLEYNYENCILLVVISTKLRYPDSVTAIGKACTRMHRYASCCQCRLSLKGHHAGGRDQPSVWKNGTQGSNGINDSHLYRPTDVSQYPAL